MATRILIIDDDELLLASLSRWLRRELRCDVHCAVDREEADALLDSYEYALVVTDLSLSPQRLEGLDLVDRVTNAPLRPKVIALTGNGSQQVRRVALRKGVDAFVEKPTPIREIIAIARELIDSAHLTAAAAANPRVDGPLLALLLDSDVLQAFVQPVVRTRSAGGPLLVGVECLTRGPAGTAFEPADALFAYTRHKRSEAAVDRKCISLALKELAAGVADGLRVSVNVHASTLGGCSDFPEWLCSTAAGNAIRPRQLTVEVIEHAPAWNKPGFLRTLEGLREAGIGIALDDIGLGQSNYQMIVDARPDYFKIDRYFVQGCSEDRYRRAVVASVAKLASELGGVVVAEGVEAPADLLTLQEMGIELGQSFAFCPPLPSSLFRAHRSRLQTEITAGRAAGWLTELQWDKQAVQPAAPLRAIVGRSPAYDRHG